VETTEWIAHQHEEALAKAAGRPAEEIRAVVVTCAMTKAAEDYWDTYHATHRDGCLSQGDLEDLYRIMFVLRPLELVAAEVQHVLSSP
jgi:hypothetical protein